jgi:hypothetical protein
MTQPIGDVFVGNADDLALNTVQDRLKNPHHNNKLFDFAQSHAGRW